MAGISASEWQEAHGRLQVTVNRARVDFLKNNYGPGKNPGGLTDAQIAKAETFVLRPPGFRLPNETIQQRIARRRAEQPDDATAFALDQLRQLFREGAERIEKNRQKASQYIMWHLANGSSLPPAESGGMKMAPRIDMPGEPFAKLLHNLVAGIAPKALEPVSPAMLAEAAAALSRPKGGGRRRGRAKTPKPGEE